MKRIILTLSLLASFLLSSYAQFNPGRLTFGGGFGLQFGDYTQINIAPQIGYDLNRYCNVGFGVSYSYFREKENHNRFKQTYLGVNLLTKVYPLPFIVLAVEPEASRMWKTIENKDTDTKHTTSKFVPSCVVGGGFRLGSMTVMLKYDLAQNSDSPYGSRIFYSVGYTFGF